MTLPKPLDVLILHELSHESAQLAMNSHGLVWSIAKGPLGLAAADDPLEQSINQLNFELAVDQDARTPLLHKNPLNGPRADLWEVVQRVNVTNVTTNANFITFPAVRP